MSSTFQTTRWSLIERAIDGGETDRQVAWSEIDRLYRNPLLSFVVKSGWPKSEAEDVVQNFFVSLSADRELADADPGRGKLRTFLLLRLNRHLASEWRRKKAQKRGGNAQFFPIEEIESILGEVGDDCEREFDRIWARMIVGRVLSDIEKSCAQGGKLELFQCLRSQITGEDDSSLGEIASRLGKSEGAVRVALHRIREQFRLKIRHEVTRTLLPGDDLDEELKYLSSIAGE